MIELTTSQVEEDVHGDPTDNDLALYLAGNQFMAMPDVVEAFSDYTDVPKDRIFYMTLPPGIVLQIILDGEFAVDDDVYEANADLYASVNIRHLMALHRSGMMDKYMTYIHNALELMVHEENPKEIEGLGDLLRNDVRVSHANLDTEGIARFYTKAMYRRYCGSDYASRNTGDDLFARTLRDKFLDGQLQFTSVHHRETPNNIETRTADVGNVWHTEVVYARDTQGRPIDGVPVGERHNMSDKIDYSIGVLNGAPHPENAQKYTEFLQTDVAQDAYANHGFVRATGDDFQMRPFPDETGVEKPRDLTRKTDHITWNGSADYYIIYRFTGERTYYWDATEETGYDTADDPGSDKYRVTAVEVGNGLEESDFSEVI